MKIDVLALGMLTALAKGFRLLDRHYGQPLRLSTLPPEEACVYAMIQRADTIGVFQIESRAQMSMLPRLKPAEFYDLVIEVAIVRPGPIQGDMVHPYLRRRQGLEPVVFPKPELEAVLGKTLGVPLFQEQAMKIAILAGFTPAEADKLQPRDGDFPPRRHDPDLSGDRMVAGLTAKGYDREFAERCFRQIEGFGEYGFPESHAASFALLVYASCWMKCRYPDVFLAAMLNTQPLGFYAPAQLVRDAREHGVEVREVDVNFSDWDATLERGADDPSPQPSPRKGERESGACTAATPRWRTISAASTPCGWACARSSARARRRCGRSSSGAAGATIPCAISGCADEVSLAGLEKLADADAFRSLGLDRREALWAVKALNRVGDQDDLPLFAASRPERATEPDAHLPPMPLGAHVVEDYRRLSLSLKAHPVAFMRSRLAARGILRTDALDTDEERPARDGRRARAGAPAAGHRQGRHLHDAGGRGGNRQYHRLAEGVRAAEGARHRRALRRRDGQVAERVRRHPPHRRAHGGLDADARPALRGGALHRDAEPRRRGQTAAASGVEEAPGQPLRASPAFRRSRRRRSAARAPLAPELKRALPSGRNFH